MYVVAEYKFCAMRPLILILAFPQDINSYFSQIPFVILVSFERISFKLFNWLYAEVALFQVLRKLLPPNRLTIMSVI